MNENLLEKCPHLIPAAIAALMLFGALGRWPYGYYQLLRFVVWGISISIAFMAYRWQKLWATWLFSFMAVLFNPLIPIHLPTTTATGSSTIARALLLGTRHLRLQRWFTTPNAILRATWRSTRMVTGLLFIASVLSLVTRDPGPASACTITVSPRLAVRWRSMRMATGSLTIAARRSWAEGPVAQQKPSNMHQTICRETISWMASRIHRAPFLAITVLSR